MAAGAESTIRPPASVVYEPPPIVIRAPGTPCALSPETNVTEAPEARPEGGDGAAVGDDDPPQAGRVNAISRAPNRNRAFSRIRRRSSTGAAILGRRTLD